jgi:hypothetical protein
MIGEAGGAMSVGRAYEFGLPNMGQYSAGTFNFSLKVPDGRWAVFAKVNVELLGGVGVNLIRFKFGPVGGLPAAGTADENQIVLTSSCPTACLSFEEIVQFPGSNSNQHNAVILACDIALLPFNAGRGKIIAVEADFVHQ